MKPISLLASTLLFATAVLLGPSRPAQAQAVHSARRTSAASPSRTLKIGDRVEAAIANVSYQPATVVGIGSGDYQGYYLVKWDRYTVTQYVSTRFIRPLATASAPSTTRGPRSGRYRILSYGDVTNPITIGYFTLSGTTYRYLSPGDRLIGSGRYSFDGRTSTVRWLDGPFKQAAWQGAFVVEREGKTHIIRLNRVTIGTNSTDSP